MIFIKTNQDNVIELYHYMPFDKDNGLGKTRDELLSIGYLVDSVPDIESIDGKAAVVKYINDDFKVEYVDVKKSEVELLIRYSNKNKLSSNWQK